MSFDEQIPRKYPSREEMRTRVARFKDLKGFDGGLPDSYMPAAERILYNVIGFQPPESEEAGFVSPVGAKAARMSAIKITEGFNLAYCEAKPGKGPMGPAGPHSPGSRATDPEFDAARRRLLRMRRDINERGSMPGGEHAAGEQMRQIGAFLRAAEANDRARNGMPTGPAGPDGPNAMVDRLRAEQRRRDAVRKLERRRDEINRRGSTPSGERAAGREMRQVGEFLRAAEQNEWVRERQVANRAVGPAGPQRPGGGVQSHRTRNGIEMSWDKRGRVKSADINDYTEYDPAATLDDLAGDD